MFNYSLKGVYSVETIKHTENQFKEESMFSSINVLKGAITWLRFANIERWLPNSFTDFPSLDVHQYLQGSTASFLCYVQLSCVYDTLTCAHTHTHKQDLLNELVLSRWIRVLSCLIIEHHLCWNQCHWLNINRENINTVQTALCRLSWLSIHMKDAWGLE